MFSSGMGFVFRYDMVQISGSYMVKAKKESIKAGESIFAFLW